MRLETKNGFEPFFFGGNFMARRHRGGKKGSHMRKGRRGKRRGGKRRRK